MAQLTDADLRLLSVFRAVARCGGLTAAEPELNIGRSAISRYLSTLEVRLGTTLCQRGRSGFKLTDEGVRVLDAARRLLASVNEFRTAVEEVNGNLRGNLRICLFDKTVTNPNAHIADALGEFAARAPAVDMELQVYPTNKAEAGVIDGAFQIGIIPTHWMSPALEYKLLFDETMYLYCGRSHPLFAQPDASDRVGKVLVERYAGLNFHSPNLQNGNRFGLTRSAECSDQEAIATLILSGQYIGFLPAHYAASFQVQHLLRPLYPQTFHYTCHFAAVVRRARPSSRIVDLALDCLYRAHAGTADRVGANGQATA